MISKNSVPVLLLLTGLFFGCQPRQATENNASQTLAIEKSNDSKKLKPLSFILIDLRVSYENSTAGNERRTLKELHRQVSDKYRQCVNSLFSDTPSQCSTSDLYCQTGLDKYFQANEILVQIDEKILQSRDNEVKYDENRKLRKQAADVVSNIQKDWVQCATGEIKAKAQEEALQAAQDALPDAEITSQLEALRRLESSTEKK